MTPINEVQELLFELVKRGSFNSFDGEVVVASLKEHADLWSAVVPSDEREGQLTLRDLVDGDYHMDSLYLSCTPANADALLKLAETWNADEIDFRPSSPYMNRGLGEPALRVLRVWWD